MDLNPTPEQQAIAESVRRWAREHATPEALLRWERLPRGIDDRSWEQCANLGWFALCVPPERGGAGLALPEVAMWFSEAARGLVPLSVTNAVRGAHALAVIDPEAEELSAVAKGEMVVAVAVAEEHDRWPKLGRTRLERRGTDWVVSGEKWYVGNGTLATDHLLAAWSDEGLAWCLVDARNVRVEPLRTFDGERQARAVYDNVPVRRVLVAGRLADERTQRWAREQQAFALVEMAGIMDAVIERTVAYVKEREQFGQKIGVFQAVQHQVADMGIAYTASRHLAWQAVTRLAAGTAEGWELSVAAAFVAQACKRVTQTAHHLHGGAGYVVEHPLHFYSERAVTLCVRYAPEATALDAVAAYWLEGPGQPAS